MRCKHERHWTVWRNDNNEVVKHRCNSCNEWLSLGPANDEPEAVKVEMRAAELVADFDPRRGGRWNGRNHLEWLGASCHRQGVCTLPDAGCQAGWLAHEIATHTTEGDDGD